MDNPYIQDAVRRAEEAAKHLPVMSPDKLRRLEEERLRRESEFMKARVRTIAEHIWWVDYCAKNGIQVIGDDIEEAVDSMPREMESFLAIYGEDVFLLYGRAYAEANADPARVLQRHGRQL
jgi:hypothetical protein